MNLILFSQYYQCRDPHRQREIDACLQANLNNDQIDRGVIFVEPGAPPLPPSRAQVQIIPHSDRLTYADWLKFMRSEQDGIGVLVNADIELGEGLEQLVEAMSSKDAFLALSRYNINPDSAITSLNDYPHWTQDTWAIRADAAITDNLLLVTNFPLGYPGCDNRIAHVMWSHGFSIKNPCYHVRSIHRHQQISRSYDKDQDRLFGGASYVHPSLSPTESSELEHSIWTRSREQPAGLLINQQCADAGVHQLLPTQTEQAEPFLRAQTFIGMSWSHHSLGSVHAQASGSGVTTGLPTSEDAFFLPMGDLLQQGISLHLQQPHQIIGACLRLPVSSDNEYQLHLQCHEDLTCAANHNNDQQIKIKGGGQRNFLEKTMFSEEPLQSLHLRLHGTSEQHDWDARAGAELVLFADPQTETTVKSLKLIGEKDTVQADNSVGQTAKDHYESTEDQSYTWVNRSQCGLDLENLECLANFGHRFRVLRHQELVYFEDRYWPALGCTETKNIPDEFLATENLLLWGFCQPTLSLRLNRSSNSQRYASDWDCWQWEDRTEEDACRVHQLLQGPQQIGSTIHLYIGAPWATYISRSHNPEVALQTIGSRIKSLQKQLTAQGLELNTHTVCQHRNWKQHIELFQQAGINTLWLSHKVKGHDEQQSIQLKPWHVYPTNAREADRMHHLLIRPTDEKPFLASFQSEPSSHESCEQTKQLLELKHRHRIQISLAEEIGHDDGKSGSTDSTDADQRETRQHEQQTHQRYNQVLSDSLFSLCPGGPGGNSKRFWESLAIGSIPVVLDDSWELPDIASVSQGLHQDWHNLILFHPLTELETLPERLQELPLAAIDSRSQQCREVMSKIQNTCCFAGPVKRRLPQPRAADPEDNALPLITVPHYGPEDRYYWRSRKCAFYDIVIEWYLRGLIRIEFGDKSYFWWGKPGNILLFERDLIINLLDGKRDPPRWQDYISYNYAFFSNQYHLTNRRNHKLTYWSYAPVKLEKTRQRLGRRSYQQRQIGSFYAGSVENETQEFFRSQFIGWDKYIDVYASADKLNLGEANRYSQDEYLELVSSSKFGVCFHGNAPKCYREIEYLALGTPLIITEGVETNYPEPLVEGLHYLRAQRRETIPLHVSNISPDQWEEMSKACWEWFDRNATIDSLFNELNLSIAKLDPEPQQHRTAYILSDADSAPTTLAAKSLQIMDPAARIEACKVAPENALVLNPDDLVINELPLHGHESAERWRCEPDQIEAYANEIIHSAHPQHKKLCTLLGLRLRNFKVEINGPVGPISAYSKLKDGKLHLQNKEETARLTIDFDWTRRCSIKYPRITQTISGPAIIEQCEVEAIMEYMQAGEKRQEDLSDHFNDYMAIHATLIPANTIAQVCKLWMFPNCEIISITGSHSYRSTQIWFSYVPSGPVNYEFVQLNGDCP